MKHVIDIRVFHDHGQKISAREFCEDMRVIADEAEEGLLADSVACASFGDDVSWNLVLHPRPERSEAIGGIRDMADALSQATLFEAYNLLASEYARLFDDYVRLRGGGVENRDAVAADREAALSALDAFLVEAPTSAEARVLGAARAAIAKRPLP